MKLKAQVSLEYLLIMAGFFSILLVLVPAITNSITAFESAQDAVLAEKISDSLNQNYRLFSFLGNGTVKTLTFTPIKSISVWSEGKKIFIASGEKKFEVLFETEQNIPKKEFTSKFYFTLKKELDNIVAEFDSA
jgi:uncharacterized protein (UPF0333 family)